MVSWNSKVLTFWRLGIVSLCNVALYRAQVKLGWFRRRLPESKWAAPSGNSAFSYENESKWPFKNEQALLFGWYPQPLSEGIDWHANNLEKKKASGLDGHWSITPDFNQEVGDIKCVWEWSRLQAVLDACWRGVTSCEKPDELSEQQALALLNDWCVNNPPNHGPNWKCAQEASIRVMHALFANQLFGSCNVSLATNESWRAFLIPHLERILPTTHYAKAQDNNHGTSEAVALYVGGLWLAGLGGNGTHSKLANRSAKVGRKLLENRVDKLISPDGTFSQYSIVYHRMMLDTVVYAELCRRRFNHTLFSDQFYRSMVAATDWLNLFVDKRSGDAPNVGANDGAHLFNAAGHHYRNFRVSAELAETVFCSRSAGSNTERHALMYAFEDEISTGSSIGGEGSRCGSNFVKEAEGFIRLGDDDDWALFRLPGYRFRPSQPDALHVDIWSNGVNICPDAGTYAYNLDNASLDEFAGTSAHNTVCFDKRNQMPRLSRFLFGAWLKPSVLEKDEEQRRVTCGYVGNSGEQHVRTVQRTNDAWVVTDEISGHFSEASLRWRLGLSEWHINGFEVNSPLASINVEVDGIPITPTLETVRESRFYRHARETCSIVVPVSQPCVIQTRIIPA